jgi:hypothetical protein
MLDSSIDKYRRLAALAELNLTQGAIPFADQLI